MLYENKISENQDLTFNFFTAELIRNKLSDKRLERCLSFFTFSKTNKYTNIAFLFSDQCNVKTLIDINVDDCKIRKIYKGPILYQVQLSLSYLALTDEENYRINRGIIIDSYIRINYAINDFIKIKIYQKNSLLNEAEEIYENKILKEIFSYFGLKK